MPQLKASATSVGKDRYAIKVTASQGGTGPNEQVVGTHPSSRPSSRHRGERVYTDDNGVVTIKARGNPHRPTTVKVTAGETLVSTTVTIPPPK